MPNEEGLALQELQKFAGRVDKESYRKLLAKRSQIDEGTLKELKRVPMKSRAVTLGFSIIFGVFAIGRFYIGDVFFGVARLVIGIVLGGLSAALATVGTAMMIFGFCLDAIVLIWYVVDIFLCQRDVKLRNGAALLAALDKKTV